MALWWLCMLALADRPLGLEPVNQVVPIDTWVPTLLDDGVTWVRRHYYSGVDRPGVGAAPMATATSVASDEENNTVAPTSLSRADLFDLDFNYSIDSVTGSLQLQHNIDGF